MIHKEVSWYAHWIEINNQTIFQQKVNVPALENVELETALQSKFIRFGKLFFVYDSLLE